MRRNSMRRKKASIVVDLRDGMNIPKITDAVAVLAAAGWKTDVVLKAYGGETLQLATEATKQGNDVVIAYGGDGTLNQVVNGVMNAKWQSMVGVIPVVTANEWATESGVPLDPFQAALTLVNSEPREVDLGYMDVHGLVFPGTSPADSPGESGTPRKKQKKKASARKHHFLLLSGVGIDAVITAHVSKSLKYRVGRFAYGAAAIKELPNLHPFPVELRQVADSGEEKLLWQGEAWQVIFGNSRLYAGLVELTPQAYLDDGQLDVCVVKAGNVLTTLQEVVALLFQHRSASTDIEYFRGAHFSLRVPATIGVHLDGSVVELDDYLNKADRARLKQASDPAQVMVDYRFDAEPAALHMTIPRTYSGTLFEKAPAATASSIETTPQQQAATRQQDGGGNGAVQREAPEEVQLLVEHGTKVTVVGVGPNPDRPNTYIIAGTTQNEKTGDTLPVAVRVNDKSSILQRTGEQVPAAT